jgi:hypothetical protein
VNPRLSEVDWRSFFTVLDFLSRAYLLGLFLLSIFGVLQTVRFHWKLSRAPSAELQINPQVMAALEGIELSFAKALRLAFAMGLALFANQFMQIVYLFSPLMHNYESSWSVPEFFLICQLCFFPLIVLLILEWSLAARSRLRRDH